jgi:hypothetical protein
MNAIATPLPHPFTIVVTTIGAGAGFVALLTYFTVYAVLPARMEKVERRDEFQDTQIAEIQRDNAQRREVLAAALATLQQIDQRTKRIEDHILK